MRFAIPVLAATSLVGCAYQEGLEIENIFGTVVLAEEAAQVEVTRDGQTETVQDVRAIGPVILGLYPGVDNSQFSYPHPIVGPSFQSGSVGDTLPYGGTTIGDVRFSCIADLQCKVVSGRYIDYQAIVDWHNEAGRPIADAFGDPITSGEYLRQICYDVLEVTSDEEVRMVATEDRNGDDTIDETDLDFVQREDGKWEAPFTMLQQEFFEDTRTEDGQGFTLWGYMDAPNEDILDFDSCFQQDGFSFIEYNQNLVGGRQQRNLLNTPSEYIDEGDYVANEGYVYETIDDVAEIEIGFRVEEL